MLNGSRQSSAVVQPQKYVSTWTHCSTAPHGAWLSAVPSRSSSRPLHTSAVPLAVVEELEPAAPELEAETTELAISDEDGWPMDAATEEDGVARDELGWLLLDEGMPASGVDGDSCAG